MREVRISKDHFIATVTKNRDAHRALFEAALEGYRKLVERELEHRLAELRAGRKINLYIELEEPQDHTRAYERVIEMAHASLDTELTISSVEFGQYMMDEWGWKENFIGTANFYTNNV